MQMCNVNISNRIQNAHHQQQSAETLSYKMFKVSQLSHDKNVTLSRQSTSVEHYKIYTGQKLCHMQHLRTKVL